ncbi:ENR1 protein, partial [Notiomystis cincta]|nr:ENR1 protein [Notiomystis cincta]
MKTGKNMFIDLMEKITKELNTTNCWICGGTLMADTWPWRGTSLSPLDMIKWKRESQRLTTEVKGKIWVLSAPVIGEECLKREGNESDINVGNTVCKRYLVTNYSAVWWIPEAPEIHWAKKYHKGKRC